MRTSADHCAMDPVDPRVGERVADRYELSEVLGTGGMGTVYKARDARLGTTVAVKLLKSESRLGASVADQMFVEARAAARIEHPNVIRPYDVGYTERGDVYIAMEHVEGANLEQILASHAPLDVARARSLLTQIASGLAAAHASNVVHRDVKSANCMVSTAADGREVIKILDFGIAKILEDDEGTAKEGSGTKPWHTRLYAAPEVKHGLASSARSDVYSLGVLAYRMLTGHYPLDESCAVVPPEQRRPGLPTALGELIREMLATNPVDRPQMAEVCERLGEVPLTAAVSGSRETTTPEPGRLDTGPAPTTEQRPQRRAKLLLLARVGPWILFVGTMIVAAPLVMARYGETVKPPDISTPQPVIVEKPVIVQEAHAPHLAGLEQRVQQLEARETEPPAPTPVVEEAAKAPIEPSPLPSSKASKRPPIKTPKQFVRACLGKVEVVRACLGDARTGKEPIAVSFSVQAGELMLPKVEAPTPEASSCLMKALRRCSASKLRDGDYEVPVAL